MGVNKNFFFLLIFLIKSVPNYLFNCYHCILYAVKIEEKTYVCFKCTFFVCIGPFIRQGDFDDLWQWCVWMFGTREL